MIRHNTKWAALLFSLLLGLASPANALIDLCGDGLDQDSSGSDASCASPDVDGDGYTTDGTKLGYDCDDTNRRIFPGVEVTTGCSSGQFKSCQTGGSYSACGSATGTAYHVDPVNGLDSNAGTSYGAAFQTLDCVSYYASGAPSCNVHSSLTCGSHIYLWPGTHSSSHLISTAPWSQVGVMLQNKACGGNPITVHFMGAAKIDLATSGSGTSVGAAIALDNADGVTIRGNTGGEITGTHASADNGRGEAGVISLRNGSDSVDISGLYLHNNSGFDNSGHIYVNESSSSLYVHHNLIVDFENNGGGNLVNNCLAVLFGGTGNRFGYNTFAYTGGGTTLCGLKYKHGAASSTFRVDHNKFSNSPAVLSAAQDDTIDHNLVADLNFTNSHTCSQDAGSAFMFCDNGGPAYDGTQIVEYNTIVNGKAVTWVPTNAYSGSYGTLTIRNNVLVDNSASYTTIVAFMMIDPYGDDAKYTEIITGGKFSESSDCVYNVGAASISWTLYGRSPPSSGALYDYAGYTAAGFCSGCSNTNPSFDSYYRATAGSCVNFGYDAGESSAPAAPTAVGIHRIGSEGIGVGGR